MLHSVLVSLLLVCIIIYILLCCHCSCTRGLFYPRSRRHMRWNMDRVRYLYVFTFFNDIHHLIEACTHRKHVICSFIQWLSLRLCIFIIIHFRDFQKIKYVKKKGFEFPMTVIGNSNLFFWAKIDTLAWKLNWILTNSFQFWCQRIYFGPKKKVRNSNDSHWNFEPFFLDIFNFLKNHGNAWFGIYIISMTVIG